MFSVKLWLRGREITNKITKKLQITTCWAFRDSIIIYKSLKLVIFGHNLGTVTNKTYPNKLIHYLIKNPLLEHFIRFSIEEGGFMPRRRRYSEKHYKIC